MIKKIIISGIIIFLVFAYTLKGLKLFTVVNRQNNTSKSIKALPYLVWEEAGDKSHLKGVIVNQSNAFRGLNLYNSRNQAMAQLTDMDGNLLHYWKKNIYYKDSWHHIEPTAQGDLLAIVKDKYLVKIDFNSNLIWKVDGRFHHDLDIDSDGSIVSIIRKSEWKDVQNQKYPILNDYLIFLDSNGKFQWEVSVFDLVKDYIPTGRLQASLQWYERKKKLQKVPKNKEGSIKFRPNSAPDIFHTNSVEWIQQDIDSLCQKHDLLISIRELDLIAIIRIANNDPQLMWNWGPGIISRQHHPSLLENGQILLFDNGRVHEFSRIVKMNPLTQTIDWMYQNPSEFYSPTRGGVQNLPNGNLLITESNKGHVFEVTPNREIVWEFYNPIFLSNSTKRATIYRFHRLYDENQFPFIHQWVKK